MPSTLAQFRVRIAARLVDASNVVWSTTTIDEALLTALADYTRVLPNASETVITLPGAGREIALNNVTGLLEVSEVWWPFKSTGAEVWPPNRVRGHRLWWEDGQPVLFLDLDDGGTGQPQLNDELRLWYTKMQTIASLDSAIITTVRLDHESGLVTGAAGYASISETIDQVGQVKIDPGETTTLQTWGKARLDEFNAWLDDVRAQSARSGRPWSDQSWKLDKWDRANP
jgi:hypothetical protein